jgi:inner membrane protein
MIGQTVTVVEAIDGGTGRVRVGDGEWPAEGPELPAGAKVKIASVRGGVVVVEAVKAIEG